MLSGIVNRKTDYRKLFMFIVILDCFFIPYFFFVNVTYSYLFVFIFLIFFERFNLKDEDQIISLLLFITIIISVLIGSLVYPNYLRENIVDGLILISFLSYFVYFKLNIMRSQINISPFLYLFVAFMVFFGILYLTNFDLYNSIRAFFFPRSIGIDNWTYYDVYSGSRFYFMYQDPNNVCYIHLVVVTYLLFNKQTGLTKLIFLLSSQVFITLITFSVGGAFATAIVGVTYFALAIRKKHVARRLIGIVLFSSLILFIIWAIYGSSIVQSDLVSRFIFRFLGKTSSGGDSRIDKWISLIQGKNLLAYLSFGTGGYTILDGKYFSTHNGILYVFFGYGLIGTITFAILFLRKRGEILMIKYLWLIPFFVGFLINILVQEQKIGMIVALLLADFSVNQSNLITRKE